MKYYVVATIEITNPSWVRDYVANVTKLVEQAGGRYLARTPKIEALEGPAHAPGSLVLLMEWPSREAAMAFYESEAYRPFRDARMAGGKTHLSVVAGEDVTGLATM